MKNLNKIISHCQFVMNNCDSKQTKDEYKQFYTLLTELKNLRETAVWISVKEQLPDDDYDVLIIDRDKRVRICKYFNELECWDAEQNVGVTHWARIPQLPI